MGFIHRHQGDICVTGEVQEALRLQPLRGHIDDLIASLFRPAEGQQVLLEGQAAVQERRRDAHLHKLGHLVPHEGHQGRDHQGDARQEQSWNLVADRLPRPGGHNGEGVPA